MLVRNSLYCQLPVPRHFHMLIASVASESTDRPTTWARHEKCPHTTTPNPLSIASLPSCRDVRLEPWSCGHPANSLLPAGRVVEWQIQQANRPASDQPFTTGYAPSHRVYGRALLVKFGKPVFGLPDLQPFGCLMPPAGMPGCDCDTCRRYEGFARTCACYAGYNA